MTLSSGEDGDGLVQVNKAGERTGENDEAGGDQVATKAGTTKKKAAKKKAAKKKAPPVKSGGTAGAANTIQGKALVEKVLAGDEGAGKALMKFLTCFERWKQSLGNQKEENRKATEIEAGAQAAFENAIESGLPSDPTPDQVLDKLRTAEGQWQEWQDAKGEAGEIRSKAKEAVKKRASELERAASDSAQMTIPGTD